MKKTIKFLISALFIFTFSSCIRFVPMGQTGGIRPMREQGQGCQHHLDSVTVKKATFEANIDLRHADCRQEVAEYAAACFEQTGRVPSDQEVSQHFGFECHVRIKPGTGGIQERKIRPTEAPPNIQAMFQ